MKLSEIKLLQLKIAQKMTSPPLFLSKDQEKGALADLQRKMDRMRKSRAGW